MYGLSESLDEIDRLIHEPARLEEAGLVWQEKSIRGKRPHTEIGLTQSGLEAIERHWRHLDTLHRQARGGNPGE